MISLDWKNLYSFEHLPPLRKGIQLIEEDI